jgi:[acyl-carrier-protein] S-malonyltransferase
MIEVFGVTSVAVVFPGQGSQFVGMGDAWSTHDTSRAVLDDASAVVGRDLIAGCRDEALLETTDFVQPALLAIGLAAFRVLEGEGVSFIGAAGHSLGEFAALVASGVLELAAALQIVVVRGRAMQAAGEQRPGTMTALLAGVDAATSLCDEARGDDVLLVANENSPQQVVISGSVAAIERAEALAAERRIRAIRLNVSGAFHSPLMDGAVEPLNAAIDDCMFRPPRFPVAANVTGELVDDTEQLRALLKRHVISPVRWARCAGSLRAAGADVFVEAGAGDVLTRLAKRVVPGARAVAVGSPEDASVLGKELA